MVAQAPHPAPIPPPTTTAHQERDRPAHYPPRNPPKSQASHQGACPASLFPKAHPPLSHGPGVSQQVQGHWPGFRLSLKRPRPQSRLSKSTEILSPPVQLEGVFSLISSPPPPHAPRGSGSRARRWALVGFLKAGRGRREPGAGGAGTLTRHPCHHPAPGRRWLPAPAPAAPWRWPAALWKDQIHHPPSPAAPGLTVCPGLWVFGLGL